jgi:hypothetical protein
MTDTELTATIQKALDQKQLSDGCFVYRLHPPLPNRPSWCIYSAVSSENCAFFKSARERAVMTLDALAIGPRSYWLLAHQVDDVQHRFLLPLAFPSVKLLLSDADSDIALVLDAGRDTAMVEVQIPVHTDMREMLLSQHEHDAEIESVMRDVVQAAGSLLLPQMLQPAEGCRRPSKVYVTIVLPPEILEANGGLFHTGLDGLKHRRKFFT